MAIGVGPWVKPRVTMDERYAGKMKKVGTAFISERKKYFSPQMNADGHG